MKLSTLVSVLVQDLFILCIILIEFEFGKILYPGIKLLSKIKLLSVIHID